MPPELLHVMGYLTGAALYAMLLSMASREDRSDWLTVTTAVLGLGWNVGELAGHGARAVGWEAAEPWLAASAFAALGFLAAVVVHSVARGTPHDGPLRRTVARRLTQLAYLGASIAAGMQLVSAARGNEVPSAGALVLLTSVLLVLAPALMFATRRQPNASRAIWMTALAVFAISALHVGNFHGPRESWPTELLGHHASIPLAFAILYQDYRFALADLFLKQALLLVAIISIVFGLWSIVGPGIAAQPASPRAIGLLLGLWVLSTYLAPLVRTGVNRFVDRVVLSRADYSRLHDAIAATVHEASTEMEVLAKPCRLLEPALSASSVHWVDREEANRERHATQIPIPTTEPPYYVLSLSRLVNGRRLLSDDMAMLERVAAVMARRIDAMRWTGERYERVLREQEMQGLATEAELRALRAQIQPHFLFNALTTIGYLIQEAPNRALDTLLRLTTLLRGVLRTDGEFTTLGREMELVACYLDIERERFEERLRVTLQVPSELADLAVPALVVQPLVENAIKHGIANSRSGGHVSVEAMRDGTGFVRIVVRNGGSPFRGRVPSTGAGVGLSNIERRLMNHYRGSASLTVTTQADGETVAEVRLPIDGHGLSTPGTKARVSA